MKASIITVGTELLLGNILNTNQKYLSELLTGMGIDVCHQESVRDVSSEIKEAITRELSYCDILLLSGGLGPTEDDMTKECLSDALGLPLYENQDELARMKERFQRKGYPLTKNNLKQIYMITGSEVLVNHWGTAPGEFLKYGDKMIFILPGPPSELEPMAQEYLPNLLFQEELLQEKRIQVMGIGESSLEEKLRKLNFPEGLEINTFAHSGSVEIKVLGKGKDEKLLDRKMKDAFCIIEREFQNAIYSWNGLYMEEEIIRRAKERGITLSFAESVTGGLLSKRLTSYPGASKILKASLVTYSNEAKIKLLGVSEETLKKYGAVSKNTAEEMAIGLYNLGFSTIAISTTGDAGPQVSEEPAGTVFVGFYDGMNSEVLELSIDGSRREIQRRVATVVFTELLQKRLGG